MDDGHWIRGMAEGLTCEIVEQMSGILLWTRCPRGKPVMDTVCGYVDGNRDIPLLFRAEPEFFRELARSMIGAEPKDEEEVREYAAEFFNVLCGRFISEICRATHVTARFDPTMYLPAPYEPEEGACAPQHTLYFESDRQNLAQFSWSPLLFQYILRRSEQT